MAGILGNSHSALSSQGLVWMLTPLLDARFPCRWQWSRSGPCSRSLHPSGAPLHTDRPPVSEYVHASVLILRQSPAIRTSKTNLLVRSATPSWCKTGRDSRLLCGSVFGNWLAASCVNRKICTKSSLMRFRYCAVGRSTNHSPI